MKLIDIVTKDCSTLRDIFLEDLDYYIKEVIESYGESINIALACKGQYYRILPYSDAVWGASCHGTVPKDLVKYVPNHIIKREKDSLTGKTRVYVEKDYIRHLACDIEEPPVVVVGYNPEGFYLHSLMREVQALCDEGAHMYLSDIYPKLFLVDKVPWTWYELGKDLTRRAKRLPQDRQALRNTLDYFNGLSSTTKDLDIDEDVEYPSLLYNLPRELSLTLTQIPDINRTFKLFSHFKIHKYRKD